MLVDRLTGPPGPVVRSATPEELLRRLATPPPEEPVAFEEILDDLERDVLPFVARISHPGLSGVHPGRGHLARGARRPDRERAQRRHLLVARRVRPDRARARGARLVPAVGRLSRGRRGRARLGRVGGQPDRARLRARGANRCDGRAGGRLHVRPDALVGRARGAGARLPARPGARRSRPTATPVCASDALRGAIAADRAAGRLAARWSSRTRAPPRRAPSTRSQELSEICRGDGIWLHVDGAYGAFACLTERGRAALAGMELADSITLDPHKWLYQPIEVGALLVRDGSGAATRLRDLARLPPGRRGGRARGELLRPRPAAHPHAPRSLKLWISLRYFGVAAFRSGDRPAASTSPSMRRSGSRRRPSSSCISPASLGRRHLPPPPGRRRQRGRPRADQREPRRAGSSRAARSSSPRAAYAAAIVAAALHPQPLDDRSARSIARSSSRRRSPVDPPPPRPRWCARATRRSRRAGSAARRSTPTGCARSRCSRRSTTRSPSVSSLGAHEHLAIAGEKPSWSSGRSAAISTSCSSGAVEVVGRRRSPGRHSARASSSARSPRSSGAPASHARGPRP